MKTQGKDFDKWNASEKDLEPIAQLRERLWHMRLVYILTGLFLFIVCFAYIWYHFGFTLASLVAGVVLANNIINYKPYL